MNRTVAIPFFIAALAASASASLTFTNTMVTGAVLQTQAPLGANGKTFGFTIASSSVQGKNKIGGYTLGFDATNSGGTITGFTISPLGTAFRGATNLTLDFGGGQIFNYAWTSPLLASSASSLGVASGSLIPSSSYGVLATVGLSTLNNKFATSSLSQFNIAFTTTNPVPEPASMAVLGLGLAALKRRRRATR